MDTTGTHQALSGCGAAIGRHEQSIIVAHKSIALLVRSINALVQRLGQTTSFGAVGNFDGSKEAVSTDCCACVGRWPNC